MEPTIYYSRYWGHIRVPGVGFRIWGDIGIMEKTMQLLQSNRVYIRVSVGFRVEGLGFRLQGWGFRV